MAADVLVERVCSILLAALGVGLAVLVVVHTRRHRRSRPDAPPSVWIPVAALLVMLVSPVVAWALPEVDRLWFAAFPVLVATYPDGRFVPRWLVAPVAMSVLVAVPALAGPSPGILDQAWWTVYAIAQLTLVGAQLYRYRAQRTTTADRESVRWGLLGIIATVDWLAVTVVIEGGTVAEHGPLSVAAADLGGFWYVGGLVVGLIRPRVVNVDRLLQLILGLMVVGPLLGLGYAGATWTAAHSGSTPTSAGWIGAVVVALLAVPVFRLATRASAFLVYRGRADPQRAVRGVGAALAAEPLAARVPQTVVQSLVDSLFLAGAELHGPDDTITRVGSMTEPVEQFPVTYLGEQIATLAVPPRPGESELTELDRRIVRAVAVHAAPALHGARTLADLTEAHARLLLAREEERRTLRRDLHDDLSPSLVGLGFGAAAIARRSARYDTDLAASARELQEDIASVVAQAREISYGLRPSVLDEHGLVAAIRARLRDQSDSPVEIEVVAPHERLDLPAAVDVAALRIVQEAVSNVRRHAAARHCVVELDLTTDRLSVMVADDGVGLPAPVQAGIGIASIQERARELGGRVWFDRGPLGGSRVQVSLPVNLGASP